MNPQRCSASNREILPAAEFLFLVLTVRTNQRQTRNSIKVNGKVNETAVITRNKSRNDFSKVFLLNS